MFWEGAMGFDHVLAGRHVFEHCYLCFDALIYVLNASSRRNTSAWSVICYDAISELILSFRLVPALGNGQ